MIKAIIFDFDGVIVFSDPGQFKVLQQVFQSKGLTLPKSTFPKLIGRTTHKFLEGLRPRLKDELIEEIYREYEREFQGHLLKYITPLSPTVTFIAGHNGPLRLALASMSSKETIVEETRHFKIYQKFEVITSRDEIIKHKPDPEIYLLTAKKLRVRPSECVVVEDSLLGARAAILAGMQCYVFLNGMNKRSQFSRFKVSGFIRTLTDYKRYFTL